MESDYDFVLQHYFREVSATNKSIADHEYYAQRKLITDFFGYRLWSGRVNPLLNARAEQIFHRDIMPGFVATELICWLNENQIVRPGYSTLQKIISKTLSEKRQRLAGILSSALDAETQEALNALLTKEDALSALTVLKQEAKDSRWRKNGRRTGETAPADTALSAGPAAIARARGFTTKPAVLCQSGKLLRRLRPTQSEERANLVIPAVLHLVSLPAIV